MKNKQMPKAVRICLFTGLLITSVISIASYELKLSDSLKGFLIGMGIGMMLFSLIKLKRLQQQNRLK